MSHGSSSSSAPSALELFLRHIEEKARGDQRAVFENRLCDLLNKPGTLSAEQCYEALITVAKHRLTRAAKIILENKLPAAFEAEGLDDEVDAEHLTEALYYAVEDFQTRGLTDNFAEEEAQEADIFSLLINAGADPSRTIYILTFGDDEEETEIETTVFELAEDDCAGIAALLRYRTQHPPVASSAAESIEDKKSFPPVPAAAASAASSSSSSAPAKRSREEVEDDDAQPSSPKKRRRDSDPDIKR